MKAHDAVLQLFEREGVETVFTLMAEDNMGLLSEMEANWSDTFRIVKSRHEQGAMAMADGYSRATDDVAVCTVGRGPAIAQTGTSLVTARKRGSKVLVLVPESPLTWHAEQDYIKAFDQETYLDTMVGESLTIRSPDVLLDDLSEAFRRIKTAGRPLAVQIPWNVLDGELTESGSRDASDAASASSIQGSTSRTHPDEASLQRAATSLAEAEEPPLILAGSGAVDAGAKSALVSLADSVGGVLATTLQAKGLFSCEAFSAGMIGGFGPTHANDLARQSDCIVAFGCSLNPFTTDEGSLIDTGTTTIHVDTDPTAFGRFTPVEIPIRGDAKVTAEKLATEVTRTGDPQIAGRRSEALRDRLENAVALDDDEFPAQPGTVDPRELVVALDTALPTDRTVVSDGGHFSRWVLDGISIDHPDQFVWTLDFGAIGQGLPIGIGTSLGTAPGPCVAFCGDAGFMMSIQELETAVRYNVPLLVIVMNDRALGTEYHSLSVSEQFADSALVDTPDLAEVAESFGATGYTVTAVEDVEDLGDVLSRRPDGPTVVDCHINRAVRHRSKE